MRKTLLGFAAAAGVALSGIGAASAFPVAPIGQAASPVEQVRVVCDRWGRCWRTGPRYHRYGYGPRRHYGPRYGYYGPHYGPRYGYYGGPRYGYGGPGVILGGPGLGLRFGF
jgi:hypothetical protein